MQNWDRALRAFDRTLALDSTFYLAYAHKIDLYRQAAGQTPTLMLDGDSLRLLDPAAAQRGDAAERLRAAQRRAYALAVRDARAWIAAAPSANAYQSLAILYFTQGRADSAAEVLRESLARPETRGAHTPFQLVYAESKSDPVAGTALAAGGASRARLHGLEVAGLEQSDRVPVRCRCRRGDDRQSRRRRLARVARVADGPGSGRARVAGGSTHATLAARRAPRGGGSGSQRRAGSFAASVASFERLPRGAGDFLRAPGDGVAVRLVSRDARSAVALAAAGMARRAARPGEIDALAALDARDTASAPRGDPVVPLG